MTYTVLVNLEPFQIMHQCIWKNALTINPILKKSDLKKRTNIDGYIYRMLIQLQYRDNVYLRHLLAKYRPILLVDISTVSQSILHRHVDR